MLLLSYIASLRQRQFSRPEGRVSESPHSQAGTMSTQCSCEGMDEGFLTILQGITRLEECLVTVAIVTGLQMAFWLGMAIRYVVMRSKKQSKKKTKDEMEEEWKEGVIRMERCLKTNKKVRKEEREQARVVKSNMMRAQNRRKDARLVRACQEARKNQEFLRKSVNARLAREDQPCLNTQRGQAESQL